MRMRFANWHAQEWEKVEIHNISGNGVRIPIYMHVRRGIRALQMLMSDAFPGSLHSGARNAPQVPFWLCSTRSHQPAAWVCMLGGQKLYEMYFLSQVTKEAFLLPRGDRQRLLLMIFALGSGTLNSSGAKRCAHCSLVMFLPVMSMAKPGQQNMRFDV